MTISIFYPFFLFLSFYLNKKWSFNHKGHIAKSVVRFLIAYIACYLLNVGALKFFNEYLGYSHLIVQAFAVCIFALLLFMAQKYWIFRTQTISAPIKQNL